VVAQKYRDLITALYHDDDHVAIEAQVLFEDGRSGTIRADLQIRDITPTVALAATP
jgi:long-chain acyl-CoA synthetase